MFKALKAFGKAPNPERLSGSPQFDKGVFVNRIDTKSGSLNDMPKVLRAYMTRNTESAPDKNYQFKEEGSPEEDGFSFNWLGHASVLMQLDGKYILTDPVLYGRASPFSWLGPKRFFNSPIAYADFPELDVILLSHDHYDHLDYSAIMALKENTKHFIVPLGVADHLLFWGIPKEKITEMDWNDSCTQAGITFHAMPARHFSGRKFKRNNTLWASYVLKGTKETIYFGGDSGTCTDFEAIGNEHGPFDLNILPIGAYNEAWHDIHMNPSEAVDAWHQLGKGYFFPIHWGTFDLALHAWYEPADELIKLAGEHKIPLIMPKPGKWHQVSSSTDHRWWQPYSKFMNAQKAK